MPDIKTEFTRMYRKPITSTWTGTEVHDIGGQDLTAKVNGAGKELLEARNKLGYNNPNNRHVECTDCHNPHRVIRNRLANGRSSDATALTDEGTHDHWSAVEGRGAHSNLISGVLRGMWGVEPIYTSNSFFDEP